MAIKDKTGNRYGKLVVRKMLPQYKDGKTYCLCDCDCGTVDKPVRTSLLREEGGTRSCGCGRHNPNPKFTFEQVKQIILD